MAILVKRRIQQSCKRENSSDYELSMEGILKGLRSIPQERALKRIVSLPDIRQGKVLNIYRQIRQGVYSVENRLDGTIAHILEELVTRMRCCYSIASPKEGLLKENTIWTYMLTPKESYL